MFPTGVLCDCLSVFLGTNIGVFITKSMPQRIKVPLTTTFGISAIAMGVISMVKLSYLPAVVLALIMGSLIGELVDLDTKIKSGFLKVLMKLNFKIEGDRDEYMAFYLIVVTTYCASGTAIFGAISESLSGDMTVMLSKVVLDFFSAIIFATVLGKAMNLIVIPQVVILCACFYGAGLVMPFIADYMLADFISVGGIITMVIGMNVSKIKQCSAVNLLPALVLVWPCSHLFHLIMG
ncbi:DUF554 domain-containing protein [Bengtsoniella intestinalis]|uniref:DUF554 domain-containing protein n=1 Tax=Bengtsoniella intestinalis TaxID=3073143 RepID=UPI00391F14DE